MYNKQISEIKNSVQKLRWWLDEISNCDGNIEKIKPKLNFAGLELDKTSAGLANFSKTIEENEIKNEIAGLLEEPMGHSIDMLNDWLHIKLDLLLPASKNSIGVKTVSNTIKSLLDNYSDYRGGLPYYDNAFVAIIEHCNTGNVVVFDHDNKGFRAIPNALKGRVFGDDNQFEMQLGMFTVYNDSESYCEIFVLPMSELSFFISTLANLYPGF